MDFFHGVQNAKGAIMSVLITIGLVILAVLAGISYRYGGSSSGVRWAREIGEGVCLNLGMLFLGIFNPGSLLCMGSIWIESTYLKIKGEVNWYIVGLTFSIATLPWYLCGCFSTHSLYHWKGYLIRTAFCTTLVGLWQNYVSEEVAKLFGVTRDKTDEGGRGAIQLLTLPLLIL